MPQAEPTAEAPRQLPGLDRENSAFWTGGAEGQLLIARCASCGNWMHPPLPRCTRCSSDDVAPRPVSGRGRILSFTINHQKWVPGLAVPFAIAVVELEEQAGLYLFTNIIDCPIDQIAFDMAVEVSFLPQADIYLPLFRPRAA